MKNKPIILALCIFLLTIIPIFHTYVQTRGLWQGIVPAFVDDDLYYYARMQNIAHGYPLIGNPYFYEHRSDISPAFFGADWIATVPILLGVPFVACVVFNFIVWSIIFSLLVYFLLREFDMSPFSSVIISILTYATMYLFILRPVAMEIVAPFFLLFCITYVRWLGSNTPTRGQSIFLIFASAISFYIYTYLWQIVFVALILTSIFFVFQKEWPRVKHMFFVLCGVFVLGLPMVLYTAKQISSPYYWDSMARIGLVNTHIPTALSFYDGGIILSIIFLWCASFYWIQSMKQNEQYLRVCIFVSFIGSALFILLFSNVITGKELEISNHIERFVIIWVCISVLFYLCFAWRFVSEFITLSVQKKLVLAFATLFSISFFLLFFHRGFSPLEVSRVDTLSPQAYAEPLEWLRDNAPVESVVWSNGDVGYYIPIYTTDFQLFNPFGGLHLVSSKEIEERYLVSHYFDNLTIQNIEADFRLYAGVGNAVHQYKTYNRTVRMCKILGLSYLGVDCRQITDPVSFKGEKYFVDLYYQYKNNIRPYIMDELKKFNVSYIVKDKTSDVVFTPEKILGAKLLWKNERFEIYSLQYR